MTLAETVRRLLVDAAYEALCGCCLAFACSVSLAEMRQVTDDLFTTGNFHRHDRCVSCRRPVAAIAYSAKCAHCSSAILPWERAFEADGDILHAACFTRLCSDETIRISRKLSEASRRLIEDSRRRMRERSKPPDAA